MSYFIIKLVLDDIAKGNTAWGSKTVKSSLKDFRNLKTVRLISAHIQLINATFRFEILSLLQNRKEGQFPLSLLC